jgi:hypothetical protein
MTKLNGRILLLWTLSAAFSVVVRISAYVPACILLAGTFTASSQASNLSADLCAAQSFSKQLTSAQLPPSSPSSIVELARYLNTQTSELGHKLVLKNDRVELNIGYLKREEKRFMALVLRAIEEGSLGRINAGLVTGPKVLILLDRLRMKSFRGDFEILGGMNLDQLIKSADLQIDLQKQGLRPYESDADNVWTDQEKKDFNQAIENLGLMPMIGKRTLNYFKLTSRKGNTTVEIELRALK